MSKLFMLGMLSVLVFTLAAQTSPTNSYNDIITLQTGEAIRCKVLEVGISEIKYQKEGITPIYTILKSEVFSISYPNGAKDLFNNIAEETSEVESDYEYIEDLYIVGKQDAEVYYEGKNCGAGGTVLTTIFFTPLFGLIPAIACASTEPSITHMNIPEQDPSISENRNYLKGYTEQAHTIKKNKIWTSYLTTTLVMAVVYTLAVTTQ